MAIAYLEFLKFLTNPLLERGGKLTPAEKALAFCEPLFSKKLEQTLREIKKERLRVELKFLRPESADKSPGASIKLTKLGELRVFGVSVSREQNEFIHRYNYKKANDQLVFELVKRSLEEEPKALSEREKKTEETKDQLLEMVKPDRRGLLRSKLLKREKKKPFAEYFQGPFRTSAIASDINTGRMTPSFSRPQT